MTERLHQLRQMTQGWVNYFASADAHRQLLHIDEWVQAQLRQCICKQWKRIKIRIASLVKLGVPFAKAYEWGNI